MSRLPEGSAPKLNNVHHAMTVRATIPDGGAEGVLVALGGDSAGFSLYVKEQRLVYEYNWFNSARYTVVSSDPLPAGEVTLAFEFVPEAAVIFEMAFGRRPGAPGAEAP